MTRTYKGSLVMQDFILKATEQEVIETIEQINHNFSILFTDPTANYFC